MRKSHQNRDADSASSFSSSVRSFHDDLLGRARAERLAAASTRRPASPRACRGRHGRRIRSPSSRPASRMHGRVTSTRTSSRRAAASARVSESPYAEVGFEALEREVAHGGGLLAGGLAYRLFLWLAAARARRGRRSSASGSTPTRTSVEDAAEEFGIGAAAVASADDAVATSRPNRVLLLLSRALAPRVVLARGRPRAAHRLRARVGRAAARTAQPRHAPCSSSTVSFLAAALGLVGLAWLRAALGVDGIVGVLGNLALPTAVALLVDVAPPAPGRALAGARSRGRAGRGRLAADEPRRRLLLRAQARALVRALRRRWARRLCCSSGSTCVARLIAGGRS